MKKLKRKAKQDVSQSTPKKQEEKLRRLSPRSVSSSSKPVVKLKDILLKKSPRTERLKRRLDSSSKERKIDGKKLKQPEGQSSKSLRKLTNGDNHSDEESSESGSEEVSTPKKRNKSTKPEISSRRSLRGKFEEESDSRHSPRIKNKDSNEVVKRSTRSADKKEPASNFKKGNSNNSRNNKGRNRVSKNESDHDDDGEEDSDSSDDDVEEIKDSSSGSSKKTNRRTSLRTKHSNAEKSEKPDNSSKGKKVSGKSSKESDNEEKEVTEIIDDSEAEEISSEEDLIVEDSDIVVESDDGGEISDDEEDETDEEIDIYQSSLVNQASLQLKVKKLEDMLLQVQKQYDKKIKKKEEDMTRIQNEVKWKDEQLEEMNDLMAKNMELEAKINFMLSDRECYEKEIENVKKAEESKLKKEEEEKELAKKTKVEEDQKKEKEKSKKSKRRTRTKKNDDESDGEDIDALFVSDTEENDIEVVGEKKAEPVKIDDSPQSSVNKEETKEESKPDSQNSEDKEDGDKQGRHNIRKLMGSKKLKEETVKAAKTEKERRERAKKEHDKHLVVTDTDPKSKLPICTKLVLAFKEGTKEPLVEVIPKLIKKLKPHQWEGVQFMWDNIVESVDRLNEDGVGQGCILAHCMGLGKTLSVITFVHTLLKSKAIGFKKCLVVCPLNTVLNWQYEWKKWLDKKDRIHTYEMASCKHNHDRAKLLSEWHTKGGIMIIGYQLFRILANYSGRSKKNKKVFHETLTDPGADLVVCDEGHMLKNDASAISKAMNRVKTIRRIVLTGTPLQNNLVEYHCMLTFVKPSLLGTAKEFKNRFVNPINNGQHSDSTIYDVKLMKRRAHILHEMLGGCVQRKDYSALTKLLPPKHEYVVSVRLSELQIELYEKYLQIHRPEDGSAPSDTASTRAASLFSDYQALMRIWTHPWVMKLDEVRQEKKALLWQDDELDTFDEEEEEEILISSDTEEETTTTVSSNEEESNAEDSGNEDSFVSESEEDITSKKTRSSKTRNKKESQARSSSNSKKNSGKESDDEEAAKDTRSTRRTRDKTDKSDTDKKNTKSKNNSEDSDKKKVDKKGNNDKDKKKEYPSRKDKKKEEKDDETVNDSSSADASSVTNERKAKVLAGEVIRKWGSMSRHGGTEALNFNELRKREDPWWYKLVNEEDHMKKLEISGKLVLLFEILRMAETLGDKLLVFSQSLLSLDLIEDFLSYKNEEAENAKNKKGPKPSFWKKDEDYLRMDGSTGAQNRARLMSNFNEVKNKRLRLFLISTKAGGLGVNLEAANRVIIFDASWNPSHDVQSIFRVYRFGQVKPVFIYRFLAQGTMEEKIYERQVAKETLAQRVIDEHQIDRHFTAADLQELYVFQPDKLNDPDRPKKPTPAVPKDILLAELLTEQKDWIVTYHEHDSLLENRPEEDLSEEERAAAWEEYEREKQGLYMYSGPPPMSQSYPQQSLSRVPFPSASSVFPVFTNMPQFPGVNLMQRPTANVKFYGATAVPLTQGIKPMGPLRPVAPPTETVKPNFQMSQLPRVVQEILKYNPNISSEELQKRLQAFLGMQNRYNTNIPGHAVPKGEAKGRPPGFPTAVNPTTTEPSEDDIHELPSRLPQPGLLPASKKT